MEQVYKVQNLLTELIAELDKAVVRKKELEKAQSKYDLKIADYQHTLQLGRKYKRLTAVGIVRIAALLAEARIKRDDIALELSFLQRICNTDVTSKVQSLCTNVGDSLDHVKNRQYYLRTMSAEELSAIIGFDAADIFISDRGRAIIS